jgi:hypothetical protein
MGALVERAARILEFFAKAFGTAVPATIVLLHHDEWPNDWGAAVRATTIRKRSGTEDVFSDYELAADIATIWCGVGCSLLGKGSYEWASAIMSALGLTYVAATAPKAHERLVQALRSRQRPRLPGGPVMSRLRRMIAGPSADELTNRLIGEAGTNPALCEKLGAFVRANWGERIETPRFLRDPDR